MSDDPYKDLPAELVALLRDPRITVPGQLDALERVHDWAQRPTVANAAAASYITGPLTPARPLTSSATTSRA
jgi:hypothetical protein